MADNKTKTFVMSFGSDAGGIEKSLIEFLKFLISEGHKVDLYLWRSPGIMYDKIPSKVNILSYKLFPGTISTNKSLKGLLWYCLFRIYTIIKDPTKVFRRFPVKGYDVAISYCQNGYSPHYVINKVDARKKIIFYHHGSYEEVGKKKRIDFRYFKQYDCFVTVSKAAKDMLQKHFPKISNIMVINNITDEDEIVRMSNQLNPYQQYTEITNICTVGRISPEKGQTLALETAHRLKKSHIKFKWWFVGDGGDMERCKKLANDLNISDQCEFVGAKSNPYPYISNCDIYVQPSFIEADPVTIREARILGSSIVATDIPAIREALEEGRSGILCAPSPQGLFDGIMHVMNIPDLKVPLYQSPNEQIKKQLREILK